MATAPAAVEQRGARAIDDAGQDVAAEFVGAEQMRGRRAVPACWTRSCASGSSARTRRRGRASDQPGEEHDGRAARRRPATARGERSTRTRPEAQAAGARRAGFERPGVVARDAGRRARDTARTPAPRRRRRAVARKQRGWNGQPGGGAAGFGDLALQHDARRRAARRIGDRARRTAATACRGAAGARYSVSRGPSSTMRPRYITATRSRDVAHDGQVVRDEQVGEPELALQVLQQVDDLRLDRDVERGDGLVEDEQARAAARAPGRCRCAASARRRIRAGSGSAAGATGRPSRTARRSGARRPSRRTGRGCAAARRRSSPDRQDRVERGERVLEDVLHLRAAPAAARAGRGR